MGAGAGVSGVGVGAGSSKAPRVVRATPPPPCTHHEAHLTKMQKQPMGKKSEARSSWRKKVWIVAAEYGLSGGR